MSTPTDWECEKPGETRGNEDHDHCLIRELNRRLNCLSRYDQYIANGDHRPESQEFWRDARSQEQTAVDQLRALIEKYAPGNCL